MEGLGGVRLTAQPTRHDMYEFYLLMARVHPGRRWWRPACRVLLAALLIGAVLSVADGDAPSIYWLPCSRSRW